MVREQKLKAYRTPIGFHDAYVAATSQKATLKAWGADVDLFARGVAKVVTDEKLAKASLEAPGIVTRMLRGTSDEHMAALPADRPKIKRTPHPESDEETLPSTRRRAPMQAAAAGAKPIVTTRRRKANPQAICPSRPQSAARRAHRARSSMRHSSRSTKRRWTMRSGLPQSGRKRRHFSRKGATSTASTWT
jgi:hypothetical protein